MPDNFRAALIEGVFSLREGVLTCDEDDVRTDVVSTLSPFHGLCVRATSCVLPEGGENPSVATADGFLLQVGDDWQVIRFDGVSTSLQVRGMIGRRGRILVACLEDVERMRDAVGLAADLVVDATSSEEA